MLPGQAVPGITIMVGCRHDGSTVQTENNGYFLRLILVLLMLTPCSAGSEDGDATAKRPEVADERAASGLELGIVTPGTAEPGGQAPDFRLKDLQERPVRLSDFLGSPVVLNFFASWCGPCLTELPLLQEAHLTAETRGFVVVGVGFQDSRGAIEVLAEQTNLTFPIVIDGDNSVGRAYRVIGPPYTFFIDAEGAIIAVVPGAMEQDVLDRHLNQLVIGNDDAA
jgi:peroxiredoxin